MPKVYQLSEVDPGDIVGDERLYVAVDPTGTPQDAYATLDTIAAYIGLGGALLDEDDFASNSDTQAPTQQSTKAYVDAVDASDIGITDAGGHFTATDVEAALQETPTLFAPLDEPYNEISATGSTENIDMDKPFQRMIMDQNCLFSVTNKAAADEVKTTYVYISGAFTPSWSADFDWGDQGAPTYADASMFVFTSFDGETTVTAGFAGSGFSV